MSAVAVQIVTPTKGRQFKLNKELLVKLLTQPEVKDREVCVVSVAGAFRKGKSFLLGFFLRYLHQNYVARNFCDKMDWLGDEEQPLRGFSWRSGVERDTTGILMWSEVFLYDKPDGRKIAIILLDTQGTFDSESTMHNCATIFALSTMLSSVQIFNITGNLQEDDLQHLQLFTEYGRLAMQKSNNKPFQKLQFLIRDWAFIGHAACGAAGGRKVLKSFLNIPGHMHGEQRSLREHISACFTEIDCFLMPHPGFAIEEPEFNGCAKQLRNVFKDQLREFVPMILSADNLIVKQIDGKCLTASEFIFFFEKYTELFGGKQLPKPKNIYDATAEANHQAAVATITEKYNKKMRELTDRDAPYITPDDFQREHHNLKSQLLYEFSTQPKMGSDKFHSKYLKRLEANIDKTIEGYSELNHNKVAIAELKHLSVLTECVHLFEQLMKIVCGEGECYLKPEELHQKYISASDTALKEFDAQPRLAGEEIFQKVRAQLVDDIKRTFPGYEAHNNNKLALIKTELSTAYNNAKRLYGIKMESATKQLLPPDELDQLHTRVINEVLVTFDTRENSYLKDEFDERRSQLLKDIQKEYRIFKDLNESKEIKVRKSYFDAKEFYRNRMGSLPMLKYVEPENLIKQHEESKEEALVEFKYSQAGNFGTSYDRYLEELHDSCNEMFTAYEEGNENVLVRAEAHYRKIKNQAANIFSGKLEKVRPETDGDNFKEILSDARTTAMEFYDAEADLFGDVEIFDQLRQELCQNMESYTRPVQQQVQLSRILSEVFNRVVSYLTDLFKF